MGFPPVQIYATSAIILRRIEYGDYDYILTLMTPDHGKVTVLAKNAKKSVKRFSGSLELFYQVEAVIRKGIKISFLEEISIGNTFSELRGNIIKTAYASYWSEILVQWLEEGNPQQRIYNLLAFVLAKLDREERSPAGLSVIFQMKFLAFTGFLPELTRCAECNTEMDDMDDIRLSFDLTEGKLLCSRCRPPDGSILSRGTLKKLLWISDADDNNILRVRFTKPALNEALRFLESFLPYHLEKDLRSLNFLKKMRKANV